MILFLRSTLLVLLSITLMTSCTHTAVSKPGTPQTAPVVTSSLPNPKGFKAWTIQFKTEAKTRGISEKTLDAFITQVHYVPRVIALDRAQPDATKTFGAYLALVLPKSRITTAQQKFHSHQTSLTSIGKKYGVQPSFIVALWAVESDFGRHMGNFNIIDSIATLAYEGRRADFFKNELISALKMMDQDHFTIADMKGSWAGAMGQTQFMPSSFLELAVDYDGDHKRDIWKTQEDVFASIANYLSKRGWKADRSWGVEVVLPAHFNPSLIGLKTEKSLTSWSKLGVHPLKGHSLKAPHNTMLSLVQPEKNSRKAYLVTSNYKTLLQWNRSVYFATSVGILSNHIH